jgi:hypothetical protein
MATPDQGAARSRRIPYWVPPEARGTPAADPEFSPHRSFRFRPGDSYHPQFLADVRALDDAIVAEGDSWFDLPNPTWWEFWDLLEVLKARGRRIVTKAHWGDLLDDMVYGGLYEDGTVRPPGMDETIRALQASGKKVFLISGGGNDLVGEPLRVLLNHKKSGRQLLRESFADYVINDYLHDAYVEAARRVWSEVDPAIQIITHGYAYARPTGRPAFKAFGPWLKPSFDQEGISYDEGKDIIKKLIDMFNAMLMGLGTRDPRFLHVDFRPKVGNHRRDWDDEMHLDTDPLEVAGDLLNCKIKEALGEPMDGCS